jgi:opacity protein-like surface antigen
MEIAKATIPSAVLIVFAGPVLAAEPRGIYLEAGAGANWLEGTTFENTAGTVTTRSQVNFDTGLALMGTVGYGFGNGLRTEFEFAYRESPAKDVTLPSAAVVGGSTTLKAGVKAHSFMANLLYDFDLSGFGFAKWIPHVGGGIGAVNLHPGRSPADTVFGGQAIVGLEYAFTPNLLLGLDYRYIGTSTVNFTFTQNAVTVGRSVDTKFNDNSVLATLRYRF